MWIVSGQQQAWIRLQLSVEQLDGHLDSGNDIAALRMSDL
jgi:hypothetical protein